MTTGAAVVVFGPLLVTAVLAYLIAFPGLLWSPIAALIAWRLARREGLSGRREAVAGIVFSAVLLVPWIFLTVALRGGGLSGSAVKACYVFLHIAWLIGPVVFWWQYVLLTDADDLWLVTNGVLLGVTLIWVGSAAMTLKWWSGVNDVAVEGVINFRFIMPYVLAWACTWGTLGYLVLLRSVVE